MQVNTERSINSCVKMELSFLRLYVKYPVMSIAAEISKPVHVSELDFGVCLAEKSHYTSAWRGDHQSFKILAS